MHHNREPDNDAFDFALKRSRFFRYRERGESTGKGADSNKNETGKQRGAPICRCTFLLFRTAFLSLLRQPHPFLRARKQDGGSQACTVILPASHRPSSPLPYAEEEFHPPPPVALTKRKPTERTDRERKGRGRGRASRKRKRWGKSGRRERERERAGCLF